MNYPAKRLSLQYRELRIRFNRIKSSEKYHDLQLAPTFVAMRNQLTIIKRWVDRLKMAHAKAEPTSRTELCELQANLKQLESKLLELEH